MMQSVVQITDQEKYLIYLAEKGMWERYGGEIDGHRGKAAVHFIDNVVIPRIKEEIRIINKLGFSEYFLILADIMLYCREKGIPVGPARGSAGGSVVSYCTYITDVEPLQFDLIFERFLNDERTAMPDIDVDLCWWRRQEVIDYVVERYGENRVAQIVTFGTLGAKSMVDDLGRVLHIPKYEILELKSSITDSEDGNKVTLKRLFNENNQFVAKLHEINNIDNRFVPALHKLEGIHRHGSMHAGGVVISKEPMKNLAPTYKPKGKGRQVVQYEMNDAEAVGLLKMDLLGLKTVTLVDWAEKDVRKHYDPTFFTRKYRLDDQAAFDIINRGDTHGIFQLEGTGITRFAQEMCVDSFNDIVALLALYRPSTLDSGAAQHYIDRKNGKENIEYAHQDLEPVLKDTYGIMIYQEQVMFTMGIMCGYSMGQADVMRKAMGKKDAVLMEKELDTFRTLAMSPDHGKRAYDGGTVENIIDLIRTFGRYGFNKSHAVAYSFLTYWTAVIKARYPECFFSGLLNITSEGEKQGWIIDQAQRKDINILPPDINMSVELFTVTSKNTVRFGMSAVKGMGKSFVDKTIGSRESKGLFNGYIDFCRRLTSIPVDKKEALVGAGAFDFDIHADRAYLYAHAREINELAKKINSNKGDLFILEEINRIYTTLGDVKSLKPLELAELENEYVNFFISANPIHAVQEELRMLGGVVGVHVNNLRGEPLIGGKISNVHILTTKKGERMAFVDVDDGIENHSVTIFPQVWKRIAPHMVKGEYSAMRCDIGKYRGQSTLQAVAVFPIDLKSRDVEIIINIRDRTSPIDIAQLQYILSNASQGSSTVKILVESGYYKFLLKSDLYRINVRDDTISEIKKVFGNDAVHLKGRERNDA